MNLRKESVFLACGIKKAPSINNWEFLKKNIDNFRRIGLSDRSVWRPVQLTEPTIKIPTKNKIMGGHIRDPIEKHGKKMLVIPIGSINICKSQFSITDGSTDNLPLGSAITLDEPNGTDLCIRMAVPRALHWKVEWYSWPTQPLRNLEWSVTFKCVSCKNAIWAPRFCKWWSTLLLLMGWFNPLQFQLQNLKGIPAGWPLCNCEVMM